MLGLTKGAMRMVGFSHFRTVTKEFLDGRDSETGPRTEVFDRGVKIKRYWTYTAKHGGKRYRLRKFTLPDGRVLFEIVQLDVQWRDDEGSTVYLALQDEGGALVEETQWTRVDGRGFYGFIMEDDTSF